MAGSGVAGPTELRILSEAVDSYCRAHDITTLAGREEVARRVFRSFRGGVDLFSQLATAPETEGKRARN